MIAVCGHVVIAEYEMAAGTATRQRIAQRSGELRLYRAGAVDEVAGHDERSAIGVCHVNSSAQHVEAQRAAPVDALDKLAAVPAMRPGMHVENDSDLAHDDCSQCGLMWGEQFPPALSS
jgi:hypothetical protein